MLTSIPELLLRFDSRWDILSRTAIGLWVGTFGGLYAVIVRSGGIESVRLWTRELESEKRDEAKSRISSGLDSITKNIDHELGCNALLSGLDQWRDCENRIRKRIEVIDHAFWRVLAGIGMCVMAVLTRMVEPEHSLISVALAIVSLGLFGWVLIGISPLLVSAYHHGFAATHSAGSLDIAGGSSSKPASSNRAEPNNQESLIAEFNRMRARWEDENTVYALKPLIKEARFKLKQAMLEVPPSEIGQYDDLVKTSQMLERMPTTTDAEWETLRGAGQQFFNDVAERTGYNIGVKSGGIHS
jgi:hypothetical protein